MLVKVENDDSASKNDIKKQKNVCEMKQRACNQCQADYGNQLCEANRVQALYFNEKLPAVLDTLQALEKRRVDTFKDFVLETVNIEIEVLPRIQQCLKEIEQSACQISSLDDTELVVAMFKTGYAVPGDHVFQDLTDKSQFNTSHVSISQQGGNGTLNSNGGGGIGGTLGQLLSPSSLSNLNGGGGGGGGGNRQKKYRTINRLKGLLFTTGSGGSSSSTSTTSGGKTVAGDHDMALFELPPQQMKKELLKKIDSLQSEIGRKQKEREGLVKLKEIYSTNQKFGDSQSALDALKSNDDKLQALNAQLKKYQDILNELESNASYYSSSSSHNHYQHHHHHHQQHYASTNEYALSTTSNGSSTSSSNGSAGTTTLPRDLKSHNIYQSPSEHSVNSNGTSLPGTPMSYHSGHPGTGAGTGATSSSVMTAGGLAAIVNAKSSTMGAYAVSSVAGKLTNGNGKMAPIASSDRNESFDDDDELEDEDLEEEEEDDEEEYEEAYEKPSVVVIDKHQTTTTATNATASIVSNSNGHHHHSAPTAAEYDRVDASLVSSGGDEPSASEESEQVIGTALVMYSFAGTVQNAMSIQENESLNVLERDSGDGWTLVKRLNGEKGYVPTDYIQIVYY